MKGSAARAHVLARRAALDPALVRGLSQGVVARFLSAGLIPQEQWRGLRVGLYRALPGELDLRSLEHTLASWGARVAFPRVVDLAARELEFAEGLISPEGRDPSFVPANGWPKGAFGIEEPPAHHPVVDPAELDVIFVPGVAFGLRGERVGMGAGFYDRYLPKACKALRIALAFDFQLLDKVDPEPWDQRVEWIWTDQRQVQLKAWSPS